MPSIVPSATEGQLRQARAELERGLRAGSDVRAESLLVTYAAIAADTDAALELIYTEFVVREELGQKPTPDEWFARFPERQADLQQVFQVHDELHKAEISHPSRALAPTLATPRLGSRLPARVAGYDIQGELGRGGMGVVYKARQTSLNRIVALKVILSGAHAGDKERSRFQREAQAAARLDHPNIVRVYEVGETDSRPYCAMEYVPGDTLADRLTGAPWAPRAAAELIATLARAADHAHQRGVIHRDLKPANILLAVGSEQWAVGSQNEDPQQLPSLPTAHCSLPTAKIADFGLAKCLTDSDPGPTRTGDVIGTPSYMAPEQAAARADMTGPATDIWALGIMLYEQLTGHLPFRGESTRETLEQVLQVEPVPPRRLRPQLPRDLETICLKCLEKMPTKRYPSAAALADDLDRWLRGEPVKARPVSSAERAARWCRRNPRVALLAATIVVLFVAAVGLGVAAFLNMDEARDQSEKVAAREREARAKQADDHLQERRRNIQLQLAAGIRRFDEGDFAGAAVYFAEALEVEPDEKLVELHRLRLGTTLRNHPRLKQAFRVDESFGPIKFNQTGSTLLLRHPSRLNPNVWDVATGRERPEPEVTLPLRPSRIELSFDGSVAVYLPVEGEALAWDTTTGKRVPLPLVPGRAGRFFEPLNADASRWIQPPTRRQEAAARLLSSTGELVGVPFAHTEAVTATTLSLDGKRAATGSDDGTIKVWDAATGRQVGATLDHGAGIRVVKFSPDGLRLASAGTDGTCQVWEIRTGRKLGARLSTGAGLAPALAFNWDGTRIVLAGEYSARVWLVESGRPAGQPMYHGHERVEVWFTANDQVLGMHGLDGPLRLWDSGSGRPLTPNLPRTMAARPIDNGRQVVALGSDRVVRVWEPAPPATLELQDAYWVDGAWSPDGATVVTCGSQKVAVSWNPATGEVRHKFRADLTAGVNRVAISRDGRWLATRHGVETFKIRLWNLQTGEAIATLPVPESVQTMEFLPDGRLATGGREGTVRFWNSATGVEDGPPLTHGSPIGRLDATTDGQWLVVTGSTAKVWNLARREAVELVGNAENWPNAVLSPEGQVVVAAGSDGTIRFRDVKTGQPTFTPIATGVRLDHLTISRNGRRVAANRRVDRMVQIWDAATGQSVGLPIAHPDNLRQISFSPDARFVSILLRDGTVQLYETDTGIAVTPPLEAGGQTAFAQFSPDGRRLLVGGSVRTCRVWDLAPDLRPTEELVAYSRLLANRRLDERGQLVPLSPEEFQTLWTRFKPEAK